MKRPKRNAPDIHATAVRALAVECAGWGGGGNVEAWIEILGDISLNDNGFEIAKDLDRYHRVNGVDAQLVEVLDGASSHLWTAYDDAVRAWVAANNVQPDLRVGDRVQAPRGPGTIRGIDIESGRYVVVPDAELEQFAKGSGVLLAYENVILLDQVPA